MESWGEVGVSLSSILSKRSKIVVLAGEESRGFRSWRDSAEVVGVGGGGDGLNLANMSEKLLKMEWHVSGYMLNMS